MALVDFIYDWYRPLAFLREAEAAHEAALDRLDWCGRTPWAASLLGWLCRPSKGLPVKVAGLDLPNPVGLAAGFDKDCRLAEILPELGFGFLELGTVTPKAQAGNPAPRVFRIRESGGIINRLGFPGAGMDAAAASLARVKSRKVPIGINVSKNADTPVERAAGDYVAVIRTLHPFADYFAINISSPNTEGLRDLHHEERLRPLLGAVLDELARLGPRPLFLKVSPDLDHPTLESVCKVVRELKVGVIATNTTTRRDLVPGRWAATQGGLSGRPLKGLANAICRGVRGMVGPDIPVIGVGGISGLQDAQGRMDAGADLIQVYSGLVFRGPGLVREIVDGLRLPVRAPAKAAAQ